MQKGVFTTWVKELCALVFVQTIQAFILAIVISIIITFIAPNTSGDKIAKLTDADSVSALGILCIVLLTSLTKMEQITKKIFGLDSGILQNKPPHGLMASYMALKAVGRVFNNVPKVVGGIGSATLGAGLDKKKANSKMLTRLQRKGLDKNGNPLPGTRQTAGGGSAPQSGNDSAPIEENEYYNKAIEAKKRGDMAGYQRNMGIQAGINKARKSVAQGGGTSPSINTKSDKIADDYYKIMEKYDDELAKAKEKRRKGIQDAFSGGIETIGAAAGGMVGLSIGSVSGLATGDLDQIHKATAYGIGVGDALGENLTNAVASATTSIKSRASVNKKLDNQIAQMEKNLKIQNNTRENQAKRVRNITQKIEKNNGISNI